MLHFPHRPRISTAANLSVVALLMSLGSAVVDSVWSVYLDSFLGDAALVGLTSAGFTTAAFLAFFFTGPLIQRYDERKLLGIGATAMAASYVGYALSATLLPVLLVSIVTVTSLAVSVQARSVLIRDNSADDEVSANQGLAYALNNVGWLVGPLLGGLALATGGFGMAFAMAAGFTIISALHLRNVHTHPIEHERDASIHALLRNAKAFFTSTEYLKTYVVSGGVTFWWGVVYIFAPIYIIRQGLPPSAVGVFLSLVVLPLVLLEYPFGKLIGRAGHRALLLTGHLVLAGCALTAFAVDSTYITLTALVLGSVGAAMLEGTRESYYYAVTPQREEEKYLGVWMTSIHLSSTLGKLVIAAILLVLPFNYAWLGLSGSMLVFAAVASTVRK